jgi:hypothetical protein
MVDDFISYSGRAGKESVDSRVLADLLLQAPDLIGPGRLGRSAT